MKRYELQPIKTWSEIERVWREILSSWTDDVLLLGQPSNETLKQHYAENIHVIWLLGKKLTTTESSPPGSVKWRRSVLFLSRNSHLKLAVEDRFEEVVSRPEESSRSLYEMLYAVVDDDYLVDPEYGWVHTVECPIICVVDDEFKEGAVGDYYLVTNPMSIYTIPPDRGPKIYPIVYRMFHTWEFNFLPHWDERKELVVYLDPKVLSVDFCERLEENCRWLGIPVATGEIDLGSYRFVVYPVSMDVHPLFIPEKMVEGIRRGCVILTNNGSALHYPNVHGGVDVVDEGEVLLGLIHAYDEVREDFSSASTRVGTMITLVRSFTYEGLLFGFTEGKEVI